MTTKPKHPLTIKQAHILLELHSIVKRKALPKEGLYRVINLLDKYASRDISGEQLQAETRDLIKI